MDHDVDGEYSPRGRAHEKAVRAPREKRTPVSGMMAAFLSQTNKISHDGRYICKRTGPRSGAVYNVPATTAPAGLKRCASEVNPNQAVSGKRSRQQPGALDV